jgi:4-hydroxy-tetrahydrodipicolinate reductase
METIRVVVHGALGKVGREVVNAVYQEPEMRLVGAIDIKASGSYLTLPDGSSKVPISTDVAILEKYQADVMVDFTIAKATIPAARAAAKLGVNLVIGTTGLTVDELNELGNLSKVNKIGIVAAPNFALGAVLMMHLAKIAAKYLDYVEIIELHHNLKADAPSGTALLTAKTMAQARGKPFSQPLDREKNYKSRGDAVEGATIHSVRLPGLMAHQEVVFGAPGQTLSIRHDTINRECYMPGVMLAIREAFKRQGFIYGLDVLLRL